jgi:hypothetical protein
MVGHGKARGKSRVAWAISITSHWPKQAPANPEPSDSEELGTMTQSPVTSLVWGCVSSAFAPLAQPAAAALKTYCGHHLPLQVLPVGVSLLGSLVPWTSLRNGV